MAGNKTRVISRHERSSVKQKAILSGNVPSICSEWPVYLPSLAVEIRSTLAGFREVIG